MTAPDVTVEARLEALEAMVAALAVQPLATVPPITIGELTNVPAPGSQLAAQWAQDVSSRIVQRFPTTAALKAWAAPAGAFAVAIDTGIVWRRIAAGWAQQTPWSGTGVGVALDATAVGTKTVNTLTIPADPGLRVASLAAAYRLELVTGYTSTIVLRVAGNGVCAAVPDSRGLAAPGPPWNIGHYCLAAHNVPVPAGAPLVVSLTVEVTNPVTLQGYADQLNNLVSASVYPRGY